MKSSLINLSFVFCMLVFCVALSMSPRPSDDVASSRGYSNLRWGPFVVTMNWDGLEALLWANEPSRLLYSSNRAGIQNRPMHIIPYYIVKQPLDLLLKLWDPQIKYNKQGFNIQQSNQENGKNLNAPLWISGFLAYLFGDFVFLYIAFILYWDILDKNGILSNRTNKILAFFIGLLIIFNPTVSKIIFTPHCSLLNVTLPIYFAWVFHECAYGDMLIKNNIFSISVLFGLLVLLYPLAILYIPITITAFFWRAILDKNASENKKYFSKILISSLITIFPGIFWVVFYYLYTGNSLWMGNYNNDRSIIWMYYAWQSGWINLINELMRNILSIFVASLSKMPAQGIILTASLLHGAFNKQNFNKTMSKLFGVGLTVSGIIMTFYVIVGNRGSGLMRSYALIPSFLPFLAHAACTAFETSSKSNKIIIYTVTLAVVGVGIYTSYFIDFFELTDGYQFYDKFPPVY
ncbi:MAG: hypothetical protein HQL63_00540 [Magnetococcales bacterium]|nr:hypothetical protein [Magnetococcales bacterium]